MLLLLCGLLAAGATGAGSDSMMVGVDDAGSEPCFYDDPRAISAFEEIGFDFLVHHIFGDLTRQELGRAEAWANKHGHSYFINTECSSAARVAGAGRPYVRPGAFFRPSKDIIAQCSSSPRFMGVMYDEAEHWSTNGVWVTAGGNEFVPHFHDAAGETLTQAYEGNVHNLRVLMQESYPGLAANALRPGKFPIVTTENVFPVMQHAFARAGMVQMPKLLKETMTPVLAAMTMGAAKQYGVRYWTSVDLWHGGDYPGHTPADLRSALLFSYWTGAEHTYIENLSYQGSLYTVENGKVKLSPHGDVARSFIKDYLPSHPRGVRFSDFAPEIIIVRFEDTCWGQEERGHWLRPWLYGASNLRRDAHTDYWFRIWNVISHGVIPPGSLNWNIDPGIAWRFLIPANNVAVYDHLASDPRLFASAKLVFLTGKLASPACLATLKKLADNGLTVVTTSALAPAGMPLAAGEVCSQYTAGAGKWIVTDDVTDPSVKALLAPYLGKSDRMRYVFGSTEVAFTSSGGDSIRVSVADRP